MFGGTPKHAFYAEPYAECLCGHGVNVRSATDIYRRGLRGLGTLIALFAVGVFRVSGERSLIVVTTLKAHFCGLFAFLHFVLLLEAACEFVTRRLKLCNSVGCYALF